MRFTPKSEKEIKEANLWEKGEYDFEILEAEETTSNSGNDMFKLKVKLFNNEKSQQVFDYITSTMDYKIRHLADATGLIEDYEQGELEAYKLVGKTGTAKVGISKDKTGQYPDRNQINDYVVDVAPKSLDEATGGDEMPF